MKYSRMYLQLRTAQLKLYLLVGEYSNLKMKGKLFDCCVITAYSKVIHKRCEKEGPKIVRAVKISSGLPRIVFLASHTIKAFRELLQFAHCNLGAVIPLCYQNEMVNKQHKNTTAIL